MAFARNITYDEINPNFLDNLQSDFRILAQETKKKYPQVREACEEAISKICRAYQQMPVYYLVNQILYPLVRGCETKDSKIIKLSLGVMQKLINQQVVDQKGARYITDALWLLMDNNLEELKVLQTILLLITSNTVVRGETLSKSLVLCFRLYYVKNSSIGNIAGATIRQLVSLVFERVVTEQEILKKESENIMAKDKFYPLRDEGRSCATDAYLLFQDLVYLVNAEQPHWLIGMTGMTETFGLDLLEAVLINFSEVFTQISSFTTLLKEKMCALIIKLFSPNVKHHITQTGNHSELSDMYSFQINIRLLRLTSTLIQKYHRILVTECEIFLSLIVRILETNKPIWQKALTLEAVHKISANPEILASICGYYDLKHHATDIFKNLIKAVATITKTDLHNETSEAFNQMPISNKNESQTMDGKVQAGIVFKGTWLQIVSQYPTGPPKYFYLDMLDKSEPPTISEDYCVSMAYIILLETIHSISTLIGETTLINDEPLLKYQLITSSWCGILPAIMTLLDATFEEAMIEKILKTITNFIQLCGSLEMYAPRDAYIHALCQSCLPHHFPLLNAANHGFDYNKYYNKSKGHDAEGQDVGLFSENETCQHIVAIGTPLPNSAIHPSFQQGPVILTTKNLLCMKAVLQMSHHHGAILGSSWHVVLSTIQHLVWILGLKPSTGGSLQAGPKSTIDSSTGIQTAVLIDLQNLSQMVSQIFESSQFLDDCALHHLIDALCKLSHEAMELAYANREPSLFAVAKLLETGIVNLPRIEVLWRPLATHFLQVCHHRHIRMREWGVEAITYLVRCAMQFKYNLPLKGNMALQTSLLNPLAELSLVLHGNVRQKQLECILQILNGNGENISFAWPLILDIIGAVNNHQGEVLIRTAFQCLQLVITDFLHVMPSSCLPLCINTAAKFGSQTKELNISLTAIGLMWNISDFFNQNQEKLSQTNFKDSCIYPSFAGITDMPQLDRLWMCLFTKLGELCVDLRPAVRKSASQTLFSTISANGNLLVTGTWQAVLWQVLFPLLGDVQNLSNTASNEKVDTSGNILIHHSRNTAQKQWAETQVLTLLGVSRVFSIYREVLQQLDDFPKAWTALLDFIENAALSKNNEVSLAAVKSYQEIMFIEPADCEQSKLAHFNDI